MMQWISSGLGFALNHIEDAYGLLFNLKGQPDEYLEFDTKALLRSAFKERIAALAQAVQGGIFSPNEARAEESMDAVKFGDEPRVQQQVVPLSAAGAIPAAPGSPGAPPQPGAPRATEAAAAGDGRKPPPTSQRFGEGLRAMSLQSNSEASSRAPTIMTEATLDALRDALGQVISSHRKQWSRERELIEAQARTAVAELRAQIVEIKANMERLVGEKLATLRNGSDGAPGVQGETGPQGLAGPAGERGERGQDGSPGPVGPPGERGLQGLVGMTGDRGADGAPGLNGTPGERGERGLPGVSVKGERGERGEQGPPGASVKGDRGEPGLPGAPGSAARWACSRRSRLGRRRCTMLATSCPRPARLGRRSTIPLIIRKARRIGFALRCGGRRTFTGGSRPVQRAGDLRSLDMVALNGGTFIAKTDDPGPCPGPGWQLLVSQGKSGPKGERGLAGERGERGLTGTPAPMIIDWQIDRETYMAVPIMSDGRTAKALPLRGLFEQFQIEAR